jgi:hypothetical protein
VTGGAEEGRILLGTELVGCVGVIQVGVVFSETPVLRVTLANEVVLLQLLPLAVLTRVN